MVQLLESEILLLFFIAFNYFKSVKVQSKQIETDIKLYYWLREL